MTLLARLRSWTSTLLRRSRFEQRLESELHFHVQCRTADLIRSGLSASDAARQAKLEFGGIESHKSDVRGALGVRVWDELAIDLRYGWRMLRKSPAFTAIALLSLALGIGANTAVFTVARQVMMQTLAVPHPEQLRLLKADCGRNFAIHSMWGSCTWDDDGVLRTGSFPYPTYLALRQQNRWLHDLFAFKTVRGLNTTIDGDAQVATGQLVSGNLFKEIAVAPSLGRPITEQDDRPAAAPVVMISDAFWAKRFGRSHQVIGKTIRIATTPVTIIGVTPAGFTGVDSAQVTPDFFLPIATEKIAVLWSKRDLLDDTKMWWVEVMGRARSGVSDLKARAALDVTLSQSVLSAQPIKKDEQIPHLRIASGARGENELGRFYAKPIYVLFTMVGLVLLLACANLANLMLSRSMARQREMGVRMALGATRARVLRQWLTESLMLSMLGGVGGLVLAYFAHGIIPRLLADPWSPPPFSLRMDVPVFLFTIGVSTGAGMLFGIFPAWQATRTNVSSELKDASSTVKGRNRAWTSKAIVVSQIALSMLLVVAAGLFSRTLLRLKTGDLGFDPHNVLVFDLALPTSQYPPAKATAMLYTIEQRFASSAGVDAVTASVIPLVGNNMWNDDFAIDGVPKDPRNPPFVNMNAVGATFFSAMKVPIIAGRAFTDHDDESAPKVAIANVALVKHYFGDMDPIGRTINKGKTQIIGICANTKYSDLKDDPPQLYLPYRQLGEDFDGRLTFEVRTKGATQALIGPLRAIVHAVDPDLPLVNVRTETGQIEQTVSQERIFATLASAFGVLALVLATVGIYGIMSYAVSRRTNEIGVRMALGAQTRQVLIMILREASSMAIVGIVIGLCAALLLSRFVASMLFGVRPSDPLTLFTAALLLLIVALLAGWAPARRASSIQPMQALRHE